MSLQRVITLIAAIAVCSLAYTVWRSQQNKYNVSLPLPDGYFAFNVPRADLGPGALFVGKETAQGVAIELVICNALYLAAKPETRKVPVELANAIASSSLALDFLQESVFAKIGLQVNEDKNLNVDWGETYEFRYDAEAAYLESGEPRPISRACWERIGAFESIIAGQDKDRAIYVITGTLASEGLQVALDSELSEQLDLEGQFDLGLSDIGSEAELSIRASSDNNKSRILKYEGLLNIAYKSPWKVREWLPEGLTSGQIIGVKAFPTSSQIVE